MTTYFESVVKCAVCGFESEFIMLGSYCSIVGCDLDTRPVNSRYTLYDTIQTCPNCGYSSEDISRLEYENTKDIVNSKEYQDLFHSNDNCRGGYQYATYFQLMAMIAKKGKDYKVAGLRYLQAAWACDDYCIGIDVSKKAIKRSIKREKKYLKMMGKPEDFNEEKFISTQLNEAGKVNPFAQRNFQNRNEFRKKTIENLLKVPAGDDEDEIQLILLDVYRRTRQFKKAIEFARGVKFSNSEHGERYEKIKKFQIKLSQKKDAECHGTSEIFKEDLLEMSDEIFL